MEEINNSSIMEHKTPKKRGRPRIKFTDEDLQKIHDGGKVGLTQQQLADSLVLSLSSVRRNLKNNELFEYHYKEGKSKAIKAGIPGSIPDKEVRAVLIDAGFKEAILHRTGHSIDSTVHGKGANLDSFEMPETRLLMPNLVVSVEPGVYFRTRFGVRSEINVIVTRTGSSISTPPQKELWCL